MDITEEDSDDLAKGLGHERSAQGAVDKKKPNNKQTDDSKELRKGVTIISRNGDSKKQRKTLQDNDSSESTEQDEQLPDAEDGKDEGGTESRKGQRYRKTKNSPRHTFSSKSKEHFERAKLWKKIGILNGKDKMMWARRAFFMSTERIFPGFTKNYGLSESRARDPGGIKLRSSVPLKMCLLAHSYFIPFWFVGFLMTQEFATRSLKPLHSYVHTCLTFISMGTDILRLYAGFVSNTKDDMQLLALYWMATIILQTPMLCFIFLTHTFSIWLLPLNVAMDILLGSVIVLEVWFGFWHLKGLVSNEINLLHMARQMQEIVLVKDEDGESKKQYNPKVVNCPQKGPYVDWSSKSSEEEEILEDSTTVSSTTSASPSPKTSAKNSKRDKPTSGKQHPRKHEKDKKGDKMEHIENIDSEIP